MLAAQPIFRAAIACGGTGGHLFPGAAVAHALIERGGEVLLILSGQEIDQETSRNIHDCEVLCLPSVNPQKGAMKFLKGLLASHRLIKQRFRAKAPAFVLGMGAFASVPPLVAARSLGIPVFLHDSNAIPGRANRWLAPWMDAAMVSFPEAASFLRHVPVLLTGTPTRPQFQPGDAEASRMALGLSPGHPVVLVMGGSQGASAINQTFLKAVPLLLQALPEIQFIHLTGRTDFSSVKDAYSRFASRALVRPFLTEMETVLAAASVAISRAGASSLAELAAMRLPSILIPYPAAADNHQWHNARPFEQAGAASLLEQKHADPATLAVKTLEILSNKNVHARMQDALAKAHRPNAGAEIASLLLKHSGVAAPELLPAHEPSHA